MTEPAPHTRDTLGTIRLNAGRMPAAQIAEQLGWTLTRLQRVARHNGYDLKYTEEADAEPIVPPPAPRTNCRNVPVTVMLYPADVAALDVVARSFGIKRSRVLIRVVENALARGILANLAHMPAPRPDIAAEQAGAADGDAAPNQRGGRAP